MPGGTCRWRRRGTVQGELLQGTLDLLILKALASGAMHGYAVAEWIHESSQDVLRVEEGALYPALRQGWSCVAYCRRNGACRTTTGARNITH